MKGKVAKELENALLFLGQAQEAAPKQSALWKELGDAYDQLDTLKESLELYNDEGEESWRTPK